MKKGDDDAKALRGSLDSCLVIRSLWFVLVRKGGIPDEQLSFSKWYFPVALKVSNLVDVIHQRLFLFRVFRISDKKHGLDSRLTYKCLCGCVCIELLNYQPVTIRTCTWIHGYMDV